jgi:adenylosuccinate synthase
MSSLVIVGAQWGDEGKGKLVDILSGFADVIVRFQGGANAGHTLVVNENRLVTHLIPSGILHAGKRCFIGPGVVVDLDVLLSEIEDLGQRGIAVSPSNLTVSERAHVVMPYHKLLDAAREKARGEGKIGTTLRGIGPCLEDKASRMGIRVGDLLRPDTLARKLALRMTELNALLVHYGLKALQEEEILSVLSPMVSRLSPFVGDAGGLVRQEMDRGRNVLFEGAQGTLLDIDHGTYPFVTSSNTLAGAACVGLGMGPRRIDGVVGLFKAYCTRVGEGPFPTEIQDERGQHLREKGAEYGATTGRPRRCGWLDLVALRYAIELNGITSLCITKLDVLQELKTIRVAVGYRLEGVPIQTFPAEIQSFSRLEPIYEEMEGWGEDIRDVREQDALPAAAHRFLERIESLLHIPIEIISVGPGRTETIVLRNPFRA